MDDLGHSCHLPVRRAQLLTLSEHKPVVTALGLVSLVILIISFRFMMWQMSKGWSFELTTYLLIDAVGREAARELFPDYSTVITPKKEPPFFLC